MLNLFYILFRYSNLNLLLYFRFILFLLYLYMFIFMISNNIIDLKMHACYVLMANIFELIIYMLLIYQMGIFLLIFLHLLYIHHQLDLPLFGKMLPYKLIMLTFLYILQFPLQVILYFYSYNLKLIE